jgi:hypothetical protein
MIASRSGRAVVADGAGAGDEGVTRTTSLRCRRLIHHFCCETGIGHARIRGRLSVRPSFIIAGSERVFLITAVSNLFCSLRGLLRKFGKMVSYFRLACLGFVGYRRKKNMSSLAVA